MSTKRPGRGYRAARCPDCGLPVFVDAQGPCLCANLPRVENRTAVTIVAHFCEIKKPTNTSRLAALVLARCELLQIGAQHCPPPPARRPDLADPVATDNVDTNDVDVVPAFDVAGSLATRDPAKTLLLYPSDDAVPLADIVRSAPDVNYELVVPDGTWAETRRLVRRYPVLQTFRAVRVQNRQTSYSLRRNAVDGLLCTLEAIAVALGACESTAVETRLLAAFECWQARYLAYRSGRSPVESRSPRQLGAQLDC